MKKMLCLLLAVFMVLSVAGCSGQGQKETTVAPLAQSSPVRVGYGRVCITPEVPCALSSTEQAVYDKVYDDIYLSCVAITDANDVTMLMCSIDISFLSNAELLMVLTSASKATGVPIKNISFTVTHNHSGINPQQEAVRDLLKNAAADAAKQAMDDRASAELYIGNTNTVNMNFVRHYVTEDGYYVGDNYYSPTGKPAVDHVREPDSQMQLMQFRREGKKSILMVNWQAHGVYSYLKEQLCADYIGPMRENVEKELDCHFIYFLGAAGNLNPWSNIKGNNVSEKTLEGMDVYGKALAQFAIDAVGSLKKIETGVFSTGSKTVSIDAHQEPKSYLLAAQQFMDSYGKDKNREKAVAASGNIIHSKYGAEYASQLVKVSPPVDIPAKVVSLGSVAFAMAPYEMFDNNGMFIKENSPFEMTFILAYTNGRYGYIPSKECIEHGCYEYECGNYSAKGNAERLADAYVEVLNQLHSKTNN